MEEAIGLVRCCKVVVFQCFPDAQVVQRHLGFTVPSAGFVHRILHDEAEKACKGGCNGRYV